MCNFCFNKDVQKNKTYRFYGHCSWWLIMILVIPGFLIAFVAGILAFFFLNSNELFKFALKTFSSGLGGGKVDINICFSGDGNLLKGINLDSSKTGLLDNFYSYSDKIQRESQAIKDNPGSVVIKAYLAANTKQLEITDAAGKTVLNNLNTELTALDQTFQSMTTRILTEINGIQGLTTPITNAIGNGFAGISGLINCSKYYKINKY